MARKSPRLPNRNESRGIPKGPSLAGCLHVYMLTCLQALGLTPMLARHRGRDSVLHCGGSDWTHADALPHPDGGTLNPVVAGFQRESAVVFAALWWCALVVLVRERCGSVWWCACVGSLVVGSLLGCPPGAGWCAFGCWPQSVGHPGCVGVVSPPFGVCPWCGALLVAGSPTPWSVRLTRWRVSGCVQPGSWCLAVLARRHGAPTPGVLHTGETTWATPVSAGVGEPKGKARANSARVVSVGRSRDPSCGDGSPPGGAPPWLVR